MVAQVADHILVLRHGKAVEYGTTDQIIQRTTEFISAIPNIPLFMALAAEKSYLDKHRDIALRVVARISDRLAQDGENIDDLVAEGFALHPMWRRAEP